MSPQNLRDILRGAQAAIETALEALDTLDQCDHPKEMLEPAPTTMGSDKQNWRCQGCGEVIQNDWEDSDGEH